MGHGRKGESGWRRGAAGRRESEQTAMAAEGAAVKVLTFDKPPPSRAKVTAVFAASTSQQPPRRCLLPPSRSSPTPFATPSVAIAPDAQTIIRTIRNRPRSRLPSREPRRGQRSRQMLRQQPDRRSSATHLPVSRSILPFLFPVPSPLGKHRQTCSSDGVTRKPRNARSVQRPSTC